MAALSIFKHLYTVGLIAGAASCIGVPSPLGCLAMEPSEVTATRLYGEISGSSAISNRPNFVFSPFSILEVLQTAQKGAAGETRKQIDALVGPNEDFRVPQLIQPHGEDQKVVLELADRMFVHKELENNKTFKQFQKKVGKDGDGEARAETLDFSDSAAAAYRINKFVSDGTKGHIKDLVKSSDISPQTRLVFANALYFKAPWLTQFKEAATRQGVFASPSGPKTVLYLSGVLDRAPLLYSVESDLTAVALPYADPRLRLYVFMPPKIEDLEAQIAANPEALESVISKMEEGAEDKPFEHEVHISLPKFKLSASDNRLDLAELFSRLGATDMFNLSKADFSGITGDRDLSVSSYLHQADIDVNEAGTEATAATAMVMMMRMMQHAKERVDISIDKPFMFQLRYKDGEKSQIFFTGRLADPSTAQ